MARSGATLLNYHWRPGRLNWTPPRGSDAPSGAPRVIGMEPRHQSCPETGGHPRTCSIPASIGGAPASSCTAAICSALREKASRM
jgi:hypothetical protein